MSESKDIGFNKNLVAETKRKIKDEIEETEKREGKSYLDTKKVKRLEKLKQVINPTTNPQKN